MIPITHLSAGNREAIRDFSGPGRPWKQLPPPEWDGYRQIYSVFLREILKDLPKEVGREYFLKWSEWGWVDPVEIFDVPYLQTQEIFRRTLTALTKNEFLAGSVGWLVGALETGRTPKNFLKDFCQGMPAWVQTGDIHRLLTWVDKSPERRELYAIILGKVEPLKRQKFVERLQGDQLALMVLIWERKPYKPVQNLL